MAKLQHVHKWKMCWDYCGSHSFVCSECSETMEDGEAERRINATEKFPTQDAIQVLWCLEHAAGVSVGPEYDALEDYISELEP